MIYTLFPDLFRNIKETEDSIYIRDLFYIFGISSNPFKIAKDKKGIVIDIYSTVQSKYRSFFIEFLEMLNRHPSGFEIIDVDLENICCEESMFLKLCKETKGTNKMIVFSKQNISKFPIKNNLILFEDIPVLIMDRDEARAILNSTSHTYIINSQYADRGGSISNSNNN